MSDLFEGQTMTELYRFVSGGVQHDFTLNFRADKVVFNNLTQWDAVVGNFPKSTWFRNQTVADHAFQQQVVDTAAANFIDTAAAGFTVADTSGGVTSSFASISSITQALPCVVTTSADHGFQTNQIVMFTDLGSIGPGITARGMDQLNSNRFRIVVLTSTTFSLKFIDTDEPVDSTDFTTYVSDGRVTLETHVFRLNNPQQDPYSNTNPYLYNPYTFDPITYVLTADTAVMGNDGDIFNIEAYKFGDVIDLGDIGA